MISKDSREWTEHETDLFDAAFLLTRDICDEDEGDARRIKLALDNWPLFTEALKHRLERVVKEKP